MFTFLAALWNAMHKGEMVADPAKWKTHQITGNAVGAFLLALVGIAKASGMQLPVDDQQAMVIGGAVVALFNIVYTMATSDKVGLQPKHQASDSDSEGQKPTKPDDTYFG